MAKKYLKITFHVMVTTMYITASLIPSSNIIRAIQAQTVKKYMWFQHIPHLHL